MVGYRSCRTRGLLRRGREKDRSFSMLTHWEQTMHVWTQWAGGHLQTRKRALARNPIGQQFDLGLPSLQNCKKINVCCLSLVVRYGTLSWLIHQPIKRSQKKKNVCVHLLNETVKFFGGKSHESSGFVYRGFSTVSGRQWVLNKYVLHI